MICCLNGQECAKAFLSQLPSVWNKDIFFQQMKVAIKQMKVISNCAKQRIALIHTYSRTLTKIKKKTVLAESCC